MGANIQPYSGPVITMGGVTYPARGLKVLTARTDTGKSTTFRTNFGTAGYVVPALKSFKILAMSLWAADGVTTQANGLLLYADNDIGWNTATALTNPVYYGKGATGGDQLSIPQFSCDTASKIVPASVNQYPIVADVPTGKYISLTGSGATVWCQIIGYEFTP